MNEPQWSFTSAFLCVSILQGGLQGGLLVILGLKNMSKSFITGITVIVVALMGTHFLIVPTGLVNTFPFLSGIIFPLLFCLGPLLYILTKEIAGEKLVKVAFHFITSITLFLSLLPFYLSGADNKINFMENYYSGQGSLLGVLIFWIGMIHLSIYLFFSLKNIIRKRLSTGLYYIYVIFSLMIAAEIAMNFISYFIEIKPDLMDTIDLIFISLLLYSLGFRSFFTSLSKRSKAYAGTTITNAEKKILKDVVDTMVKKEFYLDHDMSLDEFARTAGYHRNQVSRYVNQELGLSFKDWINNYRIDYFKSSLIDKPEESILNLALNAGFKSKSTYTTLFKKKYNLTPGAYRNKFKNTK